MGSSKERTEGLPGWRGRLHQVIYEADTTAGKAFDVALIAAILLSILAVMLESVASIRATYGPSLVLVEWVFTVLFSVEYALRLLCVRRPLSYARSFYGLVDLASVLPTYLSVLVPATRVLLVLRLLRVLRVFRVLKLVRYFVEGSMLVEALRASRIRISVFLFAVMVAVVIVGSLMYVIEGGQNGFTSIPRSAYWAIVTLTTVGYGDISPRTPLGQALAAVLMIVGYGMIAVPTGIVTVELERQRRLEAETAHRAETTEACPSCGRDLHDPEAVFCKFCGESLAAPSDGVPS